MTDIGIDNVFSNDLYIRFNRYLAISIIVSILISIIAYYYSPFQCQVLSATGQPCKSCGLTRDFTSYLTGDFSNPINDFSLRLFIFIIIQLIYRIINGFILPPQNLKKFTLLSDVILSTLGVAYCLYPYITLFFIKINLIQ